MADFSLDRLTDLPLGLFIGGKVVPASDGGRFDVLNPATGAVLTSVASSTVPKTVYDGGNGLSP